MPSGPPGATEVFVRFLISRPFLSGKPVRFLLVFNLAIALLSVFMDVGGMLLGFAFVNAIAAVLGYEEDTNWKRYMLTVVLLLSQCATNVLPSKGGSLLTIGSFSGCPGDRRYGTGHCMLHCFKSGNHHHLCPLYSPCWQSLIPHRSEPDERTGCLRTGEGR